MLLLNDTIKVAIDETHYRTKYRAICDKCGVDRGYLDKSNAKKPFCRKCTPRATEESKLKMSVAKKGKIPWNKGLKEARKHVLEKLSLAKIGSIPANKGQKIPFEQKIKISCAVQGIPLDEFTGIKTLETQQQRNKFAEMKLHIQCFERDSYRCAACGIDKVPLQAHHIKSWKHYIEDRFSLDNLTSLCYSCHKRFHSLYGNGKDKPNTEEQYADFIKRHTHKHPVRQKIILVTGVSGAGKSWVCKQVPHMTYIEFDRINKKNARSLLFNSPANTILYDPTVHVSSFIKRNSDIFDIDLLVILEDLPTVEHRLKTRGGDITPSIKRRMRRMRMLAKKALFVGTAQEVLDFIMRQWGQYCCCTVPT